MLVDYFEDSFDTAADFFKHIYPEKGVIVDVRKGEQKEKLQFSNAISIEDANEEYLNWFFDFFDRKKPVLIIGCNAQTCLWVRKIFSSMGFTKIFIINKYL